jgi:hypothetical protein
LIREIWSSPLVFRREGKLNELCDEALAFTAEAKRRVRVNREKKFLGVAEGERVLVLGEDEDGKTDDLRAILVKIDEVISKINGSHNYFRQARLLAPLPKSDKDEEGDRVARERLGNQSEVFPDWRRRGSGFSLCRNSRVHRN